MADTGIFATTAQVQAKAGANVSATYSTEAMINDFMTQAESLINSVTRNNWSDSYAGLNVDVKAILKMAASAKAAMMVISADMSGMPLLEAQTRLNVLAFEYDEAIKRLQDQEVKKFINNPGTGS